MTHLPTKVRDNAHIKQLIWEVAESTNSPMPKPNIWLASRSTPENSHHFMSFEDFYDAVEYWWPNVDELNWKTTADRLTQYLRLLVDTRPEMKLTSVQERMQAQQTWVTHFLIIIKAMFRMLANNPSRSMHEIKLCLKHLNKPYVVESDQRVARYQGSIMAISNPVWHEVIIVKNEPGNCWIPSTDKATVEQACRIMSAHTGMQYQEPTPKKRKRTIHGLKSRQIMILESTYADADYYTAIAQQAASALQESNLETVEAHRQLVGRIRPQDVEKFEQESPLDNA